MSLCRRQGDQESQSGVLGNVYKECGCVKSVQDGEGGNGQILKGLMYAKH